jgi:hypothetical protein
VVQFVDAEIKVLKRQEERTTRVRDMGWKCLALSVGPRANILSI